MMMSPPHFSVEQLLQARQNGVPDYVVVPLLQKTIAIKNAAREQAALQAKPATPPIAQQVLGAAQQDMAREAGIAQLAKQQAIEAARPEGYAGGGILAFARGGSLLTPEEIAQGEADFAPPSAIMDTTHAPSKADTSDLDESLAYGQKLRNFLGTNPANDEMQKVYDERMKSAEDTKSNAPWIALMKAGAAMAQSDSPNFMSALGEGIGAGANAFIDEQGAYDKQVRSAQDLKVQLAQAKRAEDLAIMNHGISSHEAVLARKATAQLKAEEAREKLQAQREMQAERLAQTAELTRERIQASRDNTALAHSMGSSVRGGLTANALMSHNDREAARYSSIVEKLVSGYENNPLNSGSPLDAEGMNAIYKKADAIFSYKPGAQPTQPQNPAPKSLGFDPSKYRTTQ